MDLKKQDYHNRRKLWIATIQALLLLVGLTKPVRAEATSASETNHVRFGKVIRQYALTSGNDFPQRDPQEWRLLGSNDGGRTWVTIDSRKDEFFSGRQQRRLFQTTNQSAFETYRLEIDRIRDRRMANSVQLAEVELMDESETDLNPVPVYTDIIAVQGDNPPSETVAKLFDGRVETKWLDRPTNRITCATWIQWQYTSPSGIQVTNITQLLALRSRANGGYRIKIEGVVGDKLSGNDRLFLVDTTGAIELSEVEGVEHFKPAQRVLLEGVSLWGENKVGVGQIRVRALGTNPPAFPERILLEQPLAKGENQKWVEIEGEIQFRGISGDDLVFELQEGDLSMRVHMRRAAESKPLPPSGTRVSVRGICLGAFNNQGQWVASDLWSPGLETLSPVDQQNERRNQASKPLTKLATSPATTLTTIEQVRRLNRTQLAARPPVRISGVITDLIGAFMQDDTGGIQVAFPPGESRKITEPGMFIEIEGWGGAGDVGSPVISVDRMKVIGPGKLPQPQRLSLSQLMSGRMDAQWIELEGVVRSTDGAHLLMICYGREVMASIGAGAANLVNELVDAKVRVRGVGITALDDQGRIQGVHVLIPSLEQVEVVEPPRDPFTIPIQPIGSLLGLSGPRESFHRVRVEGVLTLQENQKIFLQDDTGSAMAILKEDVVLDPRFGRSRWLFWRSPKNNSTATEAPKFAAGDRVQVVGFPETRGYSPVLTEVTVRKVGGPVQLKAVEAPANEIADGRLDSKLITLDGVVLGQNIQGAHVVLALEWVDRTLQVFVPSKTGDLPAIAPGSRVKVTGVCQIDPVPYAELGMRVGAVRVLARSASDLLVLSRPPWWTVRRALAVVGGMAFIILAALIWIKQLRRQVEERTVQLTEEIQLREQTERQRTLEEERARIAKDLHDDLGANLTQIVFLSQRVESTRNDTTEVERWFNLIPATAQRTIQSLDEIVWAINPRHDSLESLANYLSQFAREHLALAGIRCMLDVPTVLPAVPLTAEVRHNLLLAVREALQNAVTHATATEVRVNLQLDDAGLKISLADNGRGFDSGRVNGEGNGLPNMRKRLEDLGGRLTIDSDSGKGTTVHLFVPRMRLHGRENGKNGALSKSYENGQHKVRGN